MVATHFLRNAPDGTGESDGNPDEVRTDRYTVLEGNLQNVMNCLLGLTVQCARCHDHKFEPLTQEEYYSLQAIFFPVYNPEKWSKPNDRVISVGTKAEREAFQRRNVRIDRQVKAAKDGLAAFGDSLREQLSEERSSKKKDRKVSDDDLAKRFGEYAALRDSVNKAVAAREKERPKPVDKIAAYYETDPKPPVHHLLKRGQHNQPGIEVNPGVPAALSEFNPFAIPKLTPGCISTGRRTAFANWVASPQNPLFARVMVNRIWQHHFGTGLVATPDNLGMSGAKASHPELLDYLAAEFIKSGWSINRRCTG